MNSIVKNSDAELILVYYEILFISVTFCPTSLFYSDCLTPSDFMCWERALQFAQWIIS